MKNLKFFLLVFCSVALFSCNNEDEMVPEQEAFLTALVDGVSYSADMVTYTNTFFVTQIGGINNTDGNLAINFNNMEVTEGTFNFDGINVIASFDRGTDSWAAETGSITITSIEDGIIEGTFNFSGDNVFVGLDPSLPPINITDGSFLAKGI